MPLFQASGSNSKGKPLAKPKSIKRKLGKLADNGAVLSLTKLCLLSLADNMKEVWVKDYVDNYIDQYHFTHVMGPFNMLPGDLVEELTSMLCSRKQLSRAALHLLLVPQLRALSLASCPGLATPALCTLISARCQALFRLDLSGAQQLSSHTQAALVSHLPALRALSLAGTPCDRRVTLALAHHCPQLRHLDVSRCHFLSPAALLPLAGGILSSSPSPSGSSASHRAAPSSNCTSSLPDCSASSSASPPMSPLPLCSLLALDIGFGESEQDPVATATYLLLSLPCLEKVALEGFTQACHLIHHKQFVQTEEFTHREGVLRLEDVWMERRKRSERGWEAESTAGAEEDDDKEEDESAAWDGYESHDEGSGEETGRDVEVNCSQHEGGRTWTEIGGAQKDRGASLASKPAEEGLKLHLREVQGLSFACLEAVSRVCPDLCSIALDLEEVSRDGGRSTGFLLATALEPWSGQLKNLSLHYPGPLADLLTALQAVGSSLISLTLEGVKTSPDTPLIELIQACPRLRDLVIRADPPNRIQQEREDWEENYDHGLPSLPYLTSLTLDFSYDLNQKLPVLTWTSLNRVLKCLLSGSPLLEKVSLVAVPCNVNLVFKNILFRSCWSLRPRQNCGPNSSDLPLRHLRHLSLARTNVTMATVMTLVEGYKGIRYLNLSHCWEIKRLEWMTFRRSTNITLVWV